MNDPRSIVLARLRAALTTPTDPAVALPDGERIGARSLLPQVPDDRSHWPGHFATRLRALSGEFHAAPDVASAAVVIATLARAGAWSRIAVHDDPLVSDTTVRLAVERIPAGSDPRVLASCDAGVTSCRALVAQTGSILVTARDGGRIGSVLTPHHVVVAPADRLVPDLVAAWASLGSDPPAFASLITGPSRTADIERTVVLGAHGPVRLTVILVG